jgi:hypothetical protein
MTVLVTLTLAGTDVGPFNLYSNADGFVAVLATGVSKAALLAGYSLTNVPDSATVVRAKSTGACTNYIDMTVSGGTTTTSTSSTSTTTSTTTASVPCISGEISAIATCFAGESSLFTVSAGRTALITPGGYYYSGTGTRFYSAYVMNSFDTAVLYTFNYIQNGSAPGSWTSDLPGNILPAGTYRLRTNVVNCSTNGSGTFNLNATCNS